MTDERANREMSAILSADVKGYSRLMSADEEGTVKEFKKINPACGVVGRSAKPQTIIFF